MKQAEEIRALITLLDDPDELIYRQIREKILGFGPEIIPDLEEVWEEGSFGLLFQSRIEEIVHDIQFNTVKKEMREWREEHTDDLLRGVWLIAKYQYPELTYEELDKQLSKLVQDVWLELNNHLTLIEKVRIINHILFEVHGFTGNSVNYHAPQNSYLNTVLESKKGNPLSLCILYILLGEKLGVPLYGVNLPRHFIVACLYDYFPSDLAADAQVLFYINPFNKGNMFSKQDIDQFVRQLKLDTKDSYYQPCDNLTILTRIFNNLIHAYNQLGYPEKVEELQILQKVINARS